MPREIMAAILYLLFLIIFAIAYVVGNARLIYTSVERYVPTSLSDKPISNEAMKDIVSNVEWLNEFYQNKSAVQLVDQLENLNLDWWHREGNFSLGDSILTLNTTKDSSVSYFYHNFDANYLGTIELKLKFNGFTAGSYMLDLLLVRKSSGYGGGVIYCYNALDRNALNYWDSETNTAYELILLDENWHTIKMTCNTTGRTINVDGSNKLFVNTGQSFGEISLGQTVNSTGYGGSFCIDYISVRGSVSACLISFFREIGPLWIHLDKEIEIVTYVKDIDRALDFAKSKPYTAIFILLPTLTYEKFTLAHQMQTYSIYMWGN